MKQCKAYQFVLSIVLTVSIFFSAYCFSELYSQNNELFHKLANTQSNIFYLNNQAASELIKIARHTNNADKKIMLEINKIARRIEKKPDFNRLRRANIRLLIKDSGGSATIIKIDKDYTYALTAEHCTPLFKNNYRDKFILEIPMIDKNYDSGRGKDFLIGNEYVDVEIKNIYADGTYDLALVKFPTVEGHDLDFINIAKNPPSVYSTVYTVGNPIALTDNITKGLFSSTRTWKKLEYMIVSSEVIYGNSGGAIVNEHGELIGVVSAVNNFYKGRELIIVFHIGMCVPYHRVTDFLERAYEALQEKETSK